MNKQNLTENDWKELYEILFNSVSRSRLESILVKSIVDEDDKYQDRLVWMKKVGATSEADFYTKVAEKCNLLPGDELASLVFDVIELEGYVDEGKKFHVVGEVISPDIEKLRQSIMLLDLLVTENAPHQIREFHEDGLFEVNPLQFLKGEEVSFSLSDSDEHGPIAVRVSKEGVAVAHDANLDEDTLKSIDQLKEQISIQVSKIVDVQRVLQNEHKNAPLGHELTM